MKKILFILLFYSTALRAQWTNLSTGLNDDCYTLYSDSISGLLYIGGSFTNAGGKNCNKIASWNQVDFDSLGSGKSGSWVRQIIRFNGELYVGGAFAQVSGLYNGFSISKWNGTNWQDINNASGAFGASFCIYPYSGALLVTGSFDSVGVIYSPMIIQYDGNSFYAFNNPGWMSGWTTAVCIEYNNKLYFGGNLVDSALIGTFVSFDGTNWDQVGGIGNYFVQPNSFAVFNNELCAAGGSWAGGYNIVKWDGSILSALGGGIDNHISQIKVYKNLLYAVGGFSIAGGVPTNNIAVWDGNTWAPLGNNDYFDNVITTLEFFNDELYVGGGFWTINGDSILRIAKYIGVLPGFNELEDHVNINLYPNPTSDHFTFAYTFKKSFHSAQLKLYSLQGVEVGSWQLENNKGKKEIDVSELASGIYFYSVIKDGVALEAKGKVVVMK